jgi:hypothetical protein
MSLALRELTVQCGAAKGEDDAYEILDREGPAFANPAVSEDDDCFDAAEGWLVFRAKFEERRI